MNETRYDFYAKARSRFGYFIRFIFNEKNGDKMRVAEEREEWGSFCRKVGLSHLADKEYRPSSQFKENEENGKEVLE